MERYEDFDYEERKVIESLFANWLKNYSHEVIIKVLEKRDEIINNEFAMTLLRELKVREEKEYKDFVISIATLFDDFDNFKEYNLNSYPITHSKSYRDILSDMYIA